MSVIMEEYTSTEGLRNAHGVQSGGTREGATVLKQDMCGRVETCMNP